MAKEIDIGLTPNQWKIFNCPDRFVLAITGRRFGKTRIGASRLFYHCVSTKNAETLYVGKSYTQIKNTILREVLGLIPQQFIKKVVNESPIKIELINGSLIYLAAGATFENVRGYSLSDCIIDEVQDQKREIWKVIRPALADREGSCMFLGTPKGFMGLDYDLTQKDYITKFRYGTKDGGVVSEKEILAMADEMSEEEYKQEILGEFIKYQGGVYYAFDKMQNHSDIEFNNTKRTVLSFDFNVNPMAAIIVQEQELDKWVVVKDFTLYDSNTRKMCVKIQQYLYSEGFNGALELTGDFNGNSRKTSSTFTDWQIIMDEFKIYQPLKKRVIVTPSVKIRVNDANNALRTKKIMVNTDICKKLVYDLQVVGWSKDGSKIDEQGFTVSHWSDALSYFALNYNNKNKRPEFKINM